MKKSLHRITVLILMTGGILLFSECKKEAADTIAPVITLKGSSTTTIFTGIVFKDSLATAKDNIDGDLSSKINVKGTVDTTVAGENTLTYNVKDAAGNAAAEVKRTVFVKHINTTIAGNYSTREICGKDSASTYDTKITSGLGNTTEITFVNLGNYSRELQVKGTITGNIGTSIAIPLATYDSTSTSPKEISGTGIVNPAGNIITITYTLKGTDACTSTWTKK